MQKDNLLDPENLNDLASVVNFCKNIPKNAAAEYTIKIFFLAALIPYFNGGLDMRLGHFLYRLSDFLNEKMRRSCEIYPAEDRTKGSILIDNARWYSLEDWRKMWEEKNSPHSIPNVLFPKKTAHGSLM